jgi:uncharacterized protein YodC (DUF2158 family)
MTYEELNPGDVIRLKSGSPKMTVTDVYYDEKDEGVLVDTLLWSDTLGQVEATWPIECLCPPKNGMGD